MIKKCVKKSSLVPVINLKESSLQEIFQFLNSCNNRCTTFKPIFSVKDESKIIGFEIITFGDRRKAFLDDNVYIVKDSDGDAAYVYNWIEFRKHYEERNVNSFNDKETPQKVERSPEVDEDMVVCPNCNRAFEFEYEEHYDYCPSCGQKLDWRVENETENNNE